MRTCKKISMNYNTPIDNKIPVIFKKDWQKGEILCVL